MGLFSSIFGDGSSSTVQTSNTTNVTVNPVTQVANLIDLEPVERLVAELSQANLDQVKALRDVVTVNAAAQVKATDAAREIDMAGVLATIDANKTTLILGAAGLAVSIFLGMRKK